MTYAVRVPDLPLEANLVFLDNSFDSLSCNHVSIVFFIHKLRVRLHVALPQDGKVVWILCVLYVVIGVLVVSPDHTAFRHGERVEAHGLQRFEGFAS